MSRRKAKARARAPLREGSAITSSESERFTLGQVINQGGAGTIYSVMERPSLVAKIYHPNQNLQEYERKLRAMVAPSPELSHEQGPLAQLAWPTSLLFAGHFCGFLMPRLDLRSTLEIESILQERQARALGHHLGLGKRLTLAANLSVTLAALHRRRHYVVDLKPANIRFHHASLSVTMLDCDGFSVQGSDERFDAPQVTPDYLAPEFHGASVNGHELQQDLFALAVVVFRLLQAGVHPFAGRPGRGDVPTDLPARIAGRYFAHGLSRHARISPSPVSFMEMTPRHIRSVFDRALSGPEHARPTAEEWSDLLLPYTKRSVGHLVVCGTDSTHQHYRAHACAACARAKLMRKANRTPVRSPARTAGGKPVLARSQPGLVTIAPNHTAPSAATLSQPASFRKKWWHFLILAAIPATCVANSMMVSNAFKSSEPRMRGSSIEHNATERPSLPDLRRTDADERSMIELATSEIQSLLGAVALRDREAYEKHTSVLAMAAESFAEKYANRPYKGVEKAYAQQLLARLSMREVREMSSDDRADFSRVVLSDPTLALAWDLLGTSLALGEHADEASSAYAVSSLLADTGHMPWATWALVATNDDLTALNRLKILWARGLVAACALSGEQCTQSKIELAAEPLPPFPATVRR